MDQCSAPVVRLNRGNGYSMLNRLRNLARRDVIPLAEDTKESNDTAFLNALSILGEAAASSALGRGRRFQMESPQWMGRICLEHNLDQIRRSAEQRMSGKSGAAEQNNKDSENWERSLELHEKRKMKKAEAALRRLLNIQEC